ncbi:tyrosyl-DNA phosphodiesterase I [Spinellus fusiger]|nr:tyrosyl-DNA phosphodiesterase I [Spinellus fusiger]
MCIIRHGRPAIRNQISSHRVILQPPMMSNTYGVFHPKLMLLFREDSMRVVIGSANLEGYDYQSIENVVFIQDFPKLSECLSSTNTLPPFAKELTNFLDKMQVPVSVKDAFLDYDFMLMMTWCDEQAHIVASVSGVFEGDEYQSYGHPRLAKVIKALGAVDPNRLPTVEMQTSSLGGMNSLYLHELYTSFCGINPYENTRRPQIQKNASLPPISIIYPSYNTVESSKLGQHGASTICLSKSSWKNPNFPKQVMCDAISYREGSLMHSKGVVYPNVYLSHNATRAAWGKRSLSRESKQPKISMSNWELGVVMPIYESTEIVAPFLRPAPRYRDGQSAWTQDLF